MHKTAAAGTARRRARRAHPVHPEADLDANARQGQEDQREDVGQEGEHAHAQALRDRKRRLDAHLVEQREAGALAAEERDGDGVQQPGDGALRVSAGAAGAAGTAAALAPARTTTDATLKECNADASNDRASYPASMCCLHMIVK